MKFYLKEYDSNVCLINDADSITKARRLIENFSEGGKVFFLDQSGLQSKDHLKTLNFSFLFEEFMH